MVILKDKKTRGSIAGFIIGIAIIIAVTIALYFISLMNNNIIYELKDDSSLNDTTTKSGQLIDQMKDKPVQWGDNWMVFLYFGWILAMVISGIYTKFDPAVMIIFFMVLLVITWLAMQGANFYGDLSDETSNMIRGTEKFGMSDAIFKKPFPIITLAAGVILVIIMYAKRDEGGF